MKKRKNLLLLLMISGTALVSCGSTKTNSFDGKYFDTSVNKDFSTYVYIKKEDNSSKYNLYFNGTGEIKDYLDSKAPWYTLARKINKVYFSEGITSIGSNTFTNYSLDSFFLPKSVKNIKEDAFKDGTSIYTYSDSLTYSDNLSVYYYSSTEPVDSTKNYFHFENGGISYWNIVSKKVLFIGNSFTFYSDVPDLTYKIATDLKCKINVDSVTKGAHTLEKFSDPTDEMGKIVYEKLENNQYDYVILQEQSSRPLNAYDKFYAGVSTLKDAINKYQKNCDIRLYETWGYAEEAAAHKYDIPTMEKELRKAYDNVATSLDLKVHYVGKAFTYIYENNKDINLYFTDNKHPSYTGAFLSALVHVGNIFKTDFTNLTFNGELDKNTVNSLIKAANYALH